MSIQIPNILTVYVKHNEMSLVSSRYSFTNILTSTSQLILKI